MQLSKRNGVACWGFLFNDLFILSSVAGKRSSTRKSLHIKFTTSLKACTVEDARDEEGLFVRIPVSFADVCFKITNHQSKKEYLLGVGSPKEKKDWIDEFNKASEALKNGRKPGF